jgi:hypothetical protein
MLKAMDHSLHGMNLVPGLDLQEHSAASLILSGWDNSSSTSVISSSSLTWKGANAIQCIICNNGSTPSGWGTK